MTRELQTTLAPSGILWPVIRNHIPRMVHLIELSFGAFMSCVRVTGRTMPCDAHVNNLQFGENASTDIGKSQRLQNEGDARISNVSGMRLGSEKIIERVCISRDCKWAETDIDTAENACCIDYVVSWSSKWVHWLWTSPSTNHSTTYYGCEHTVEFYTGVDWVSLPITRIHPRVD